MAENAKVLIENGGHKSGALTVNWLAKEQWLAWKKRVMTAAHAHTPFQCEYPRACYLDALFSRKFLFAWYFEICVSSLDDDY